MSIIASALAGLLKMGARCLGPYGSWRVFHEWYRKNPESARELIQYILQSEKPDVPVADTFLAHWLGDERLTHAVRQQTGQLGSPFYAFMLYQQIVRLCREQSLDPRRVLEIGPGIHVGALFCFAASGCEKAAGIDIQPMQEHPEFYETLKRYLSAAGGFGWWRYTAAVNPYPEIRHPANWDDVDAAKILAGIDYRTPVPAESMPFDDGSFDLVYSVTAFEHFPEPDRTVREIRRVLQPGGITIHEIDMRQHIDMRAHKPADALGFLSWSADEHATRSDLYGDGKGLESLLKGDWATGERAVYCNRLRLSDYEELLRAEGFELLKVEPVELLAESEVHRDEFLEPYRSKSVEDLSILVARIVARKPK